MVSAILGSRIPLRKITIIFFREFPTVGGERLVVINCPGHTSTSSMRLGFSTLFDLCLPMELAAERRKGKTGPQVWTLHIGVH